MIAPNRKRDFLKPTERVQEKFRRLLLLVDAMAPRRHFMSIEEIRELVADRSGIEWHHRTIQRDLELLRSLGFVEDQKRMWSPGQSYIYRLNLRTTEGLQVAALKL